MTHPTDAAIAQAFREMKETHFLMAGTFGLIEARARELDAAKGVAGYRCAGCADWANCPYGPTGCIQSATPPAQAAEARAEAARDFPANTCPASRHVQLIAEAIKAGKFKPEPYMADSLFTVVAELWELRAATESKP